jgi:hypothetical protein
MGNTNEAFELTDQHLKVLREMVFLWVDAEGGGPWMFGYSPTFHYSDDDEDLVPYDVIDRHTDLCRILGLDGDPAALSETQLKQLDDLHESMGVALEIGLETAQLQPGEYPYGNYFQKFQFPDLSSFMPPLFDTWERYSAYKHMPVPQGDSITFQLTDEHLKLLRKLRVDWNQPQSYTGINFKRPYGDMTYFELDLAAILGITVPYDEHKEVHFSDEQRSYFHTLHTDMLFALPVLLRQGKISAGRYQIVDGDWALVS